MWLLLPIGFFSIVRKPGDRHLTVRARVAADLDNLRMLIPALSETLATPDADYQFRATVSPVNLAIGLGDIVQGIDYDNFKNEVSRRQGHGRAILYSRLWITLRGLVKLGGR